MHGKKGRSPGYQRNNHWVVCDRCGFDYRVKDVKTEWNGLVVCGKCYEPRHPQDLVRGVKDDTSPVGPTRPEPETDTFTSVTYCLTWSAEAGVAEAGCAEAGADGGPIEDPTVPTGTFS